jgi:hypothetical protein
MTSALCQDVESMELYLHALCSHPLCGVLLRDMWSQEQDIKIPFNNVAYI